MQTTEIELSDGISKAAVEEAIEKMEFHNKGTNIGEGIEYATKFTFKHARPGAAKMLIVIADGKSSDDTQQGADDARDSGIDLVAVGVGDGIDEEGMQKIAGPDGKILSVKDYAHLGTILANTTEIVCDEVSTPKPTPAPTPEPTLEPTTPRPTPVPTLPPDATSKVCVKNTFPSRKMWFEVLSGGNQVFKSGKFKKKAGWVCKDLANMVVDGTKLDIRIDVGKTIKKKFPPKTYSVTYYKHGNSWMSTCDKTGVGAW